MANASRVKPNSPRRRHYNGQDGPTIKEREYLEVIYYLVARGEPVIAARLARWMGVQPPTVTHIVQQLETKKYIRRDGRGEISLTAEGAVLAESVVKRHRILERFLVDVMGLPWHLIHEEAVRLEHALSPTMAARIESLVGHSTTCPHGNPIPGASEHYPGSVRLDGTEAGMLFMIKRIVEEAEEDSDLMRYLHINNIVPGSQFMITDVSPAYGVTLQSGEQSITVSPEIASLIWGDPV